MTSKQPNTATLHVCTRSNQDYCKFRHYNNVFGFCMLVSVYNNINSISLTYKDITHVLSSTHKNHYVNSPQHNELDWCSGDSPPSGSRAAVQAVIRRRIPTKARVQSQASPHRISDVQNGTVKGFSPSASVFPPSVSSQQCSIFTHSASTYAIQAYSLQLDSSLYNTLSLSLSLPPPPPLFHRQVHYKHFRNYNILVLEIEKENGVPEFLAPLTKLRTLHHRTGQMLALCSGPNRVGSPFALPT